jgi:hypothetical protein
MAALRELAGVVAQRDEMVAAQAARRNENLRLSVEIR